MHSNNLLQNHNNAICIDNLKFSYKKNENVILNIPSWKVATKEKVFVQGSSGSGKSTLLNLLAGVLTPTEGNIKVLGQNIERMNSRQRDHFRAAHIGVVFQQFNLIPYLSVLDNIYLAAHFSKKTTPVKERAKELFSSVKIDHTLLKQKAGELSLGQQQRVAIVRALINQPEILIIDEPTSALDADNRDAFIQLLMQVADNSTLIFVSHDAALAKHFAQKIDLSQINLPEVNLSQTNLLKNNTATEKA